MQDINDAIALYPPVRQALVTRSVKFSPEHFLKTLRRSWRFSVGIFLALFVPMLLVALQQPVLYRAEGKILLGNAVRINLEMSTALSAKERERVLPLEEMNSQAEILKSSKLLLGVIRELGFARSAEEEVEEMKRLRNQISVRVIPTSSIISVSYEAPDSEIARAVVNTLTLLYQRYYMRIIEGDDPLALYQNQFDFNEQALGDNMQSLEVLRNELGIEGGYDSERERLTVRLNDLRAQLDRVRLALGKSEDSASILRQQLGQEPETIKVRTESIPNPQATELNMELNRLGSERAELLTRYTERHHQVVRKNKEISALEARLRSLPLYITGSSGYANNPLQEKLHNGLNQAEIEITQLSTERDQLEKAISDTENQLDRLGESAFRLTSLEGAISANNKALQLYHNKLVDARLLDTMNRENLIPTSIIEDALVATPSDKRPNIIAASLILSLLLTLGIVFLRDWRQPRLRSAEELRALLRVPVLATISDASRGHSLVERGVEKSG